MMVNVQGILMAILSSGIEKQNSTLGNVIGRQKSIIIAFKQVVFLYLGSYLYICIILLILPRPKPSIHSSIQL